MKRAVYPPFKATCIVTVQLADNKSYNPDIAMRLSFYINHQDDVYGHAKREGQHQRSATWYRGRV